MQKTTRRLTFKIPNRLILDGALSYSAKRMGAVLYSRRNPLGSCRKSLVQLSNLAACSIATARKALAELEAAGYIERCKHFKYSEAHGRVVYDKYTYHCNLTFHGGFTLIPREVFCHTLQASSFTVALYLYYQAGNKHRAYPSLRRMCRDLWIGPATLCRALRQLDAAGLIYTEACVRVNRAFTNNSYFICIAIAAPGPCAAQTAPGSSRRSHALDLLRSRFSLQRMSLQVGSVPFPCHDYMLSKLKNQVFSVGRGVFKISKQELRLR